LATTLAGWGEASRERAGAIALPFRAILATYSHPLQKPAPGQNDFWNQKLWSSKIASWAEEGYNAAVWLGPSEFGAAADGADHLLIRLKEFPEARQLSLEENERVIGQMKSLFREAKQHGMQNLMYTQTIRFTFAFE